MAQVLSNRRLFTRSASAAHIQWLKKSLLAKFKQLADGQIAASDLAEELAAKIDKLEQDRIRDPLTGAFNRGFMGAVLGQEMALSHKNKQSLGFVMLDIDYFKSINDKEPDGHGAGDRILIEIKKLLSEICGNHSLVGRWGGEEFAVIVPSITPESLLEEATDIGQTIAGWLAKNAKLRRPQVTASLGAVIAQPKEAGVDVISRADKLMYEAKESGRARLILDTGKEKVVVKFI